MDLRAVIVEAKNGSYRAQNDIIKHFEPLIKSTINKKRYYSNVMSKEDFEQLHRIGIWMAIDTFPQHFYKVKKNEHGQLVFTEFDGTHRFIGWMKMCMQHHVTKELRKEHQKCRQVDLVYIDEDDGNNSCDDRHQSLAEKMPAIRSFQEASIGFFERLKETLNVKEATCFQLLADGYTFNDVAIEVRKQHPNLRKDDVRAIRDNMLNKVKQGVYGYV